MIHGFRALGLGFGGLGFRVWGLGFMIHGPYSYIWLAGNEGLEPKVETVIVGYIGTTIRIHSFIPS